MFKDEWLKHYKKRRAEGRSPQQARAIAKHDARYGAGSRKVAHVLESSYVAYEGTQEVKYPNGWTLKVEIKYDDDDHGPPWEDCDGHGVITGWVPRMDHMEGWYLNRCGSSYRYYDYKATLPKAIKEQWDAPPYRTGTKLEQAMRAMRADYEYLRGWCHDEWWYVGLIVTLRDENGRELDEESCWGYESMCVDYIASEARSWAAHMIRKARDEKRAEIWQEKVDRRFADAMACGI